jgi:hypothetical protein
MLTGQKIEAGGLLVDPRLALNQIFCHSFLILLARRIKKDLSVFHGGSDTGEIIRPESFSGL